MIQEASHQNIESITRIYNHYISNTVVTFEEDEISRSDIKASPDRIQSSGFPWIVTGSDDGICG